MSFWVVKFKTFDPISGDVPDRPFSYLPDIAWRARRLIKTRTFQQISLIAENIEFAIDAYFDEIQAEEYERLRKERGWNIDKEGIAYFEPYSIDEGGFESDLIDPDDPPKELVYGGKHTDPEDGIVLNWFYVDLDIPGPSNTSYLDALKECSEYWDEIRNVNGESDVRPYELFAVLSLCLIADSITWLKNQGLELPDLWIEINGKRTTIASSNFAAGYAMKAMEAICFAEHLHETEKINDIHQIELNNVQDDYLQEKAKQEEEARKQRKERTEQLNQHRHKQTNEAKAMVITEWVKEPSIFPSGEKAGRYYADWLQKKGIKYEPRTVTGWIRKAAKEKSIRLR